MSTRTDTLFPYTTLFRSYAADDHSDIHALVRITPDADGASLEFTDWRARPLVQPQMPSIAEGAVVPQSWTWECDQQLRIVALCAAPDAPPVPEGWEGCSLSEVFELQPDEDGRFPVLRGLARQARFDGQRVRAAQTAMILAEIGRA